MTYSEMKFTPDDKINAFNTIAKFFYEKNFGTMSKGDMELLMFSIYYDKAKSMNQASLLRSYELSKSLGITQSKVDNLKEKYSTRYLKSDSVISADELVEIFNTAKLVDADTIKILVQDRIAYIEIRNLIETGNGIVEMSFNKSEMILSIEDFLQLVYLMADEKEREKINEAITKKKEERKIQIDETIQDSVEGKTFLRRIKKDFPGFAKDVLVQLAADVLPAPIGTLISSVAKHFSKENKE